MRTTALILFCLLLTACSSSEKKEAVTEAPKKPVETKAPPSFQVKFDTSEGAFTMNCTRELAPTGADRFYELVNRQFFDDGRFFRVMKNFVVQFGLNGDPKVNQLWSQMNILDDPPRESNQRGTVTFAKRGPNTRTTQMFINLKNNAMLDGQGFAPFCKVDEAGMEVVDKLYGGYGDGIPNGNGPEQAKIQAMGNEYLLREFPKLSFIKTAKVQ